IDAVALVTRSTAALVRPDDALGFAQNAYRRVARFAQAASICIVAAREPRLFTHAAAVECTGESDYLAGSFSSAERELSAVDNPQGPIYPGLGSTPGAFRVDVQAAFAAARAHSSGLWMDPSK